MFISSASDLITLTNCSWKHKNIIFNFISYSLWKSKHERSISQISVRQPKTSWVVELFHLCCMIICVFITYIKGTLKLELFKVELRGFTVFVTVCLGSRGVASADFLSIFPSESRLHAQEDIRGPLSELQQEVLPDIQDQIQDYRYTN